MTPYILGDYISNLHILVDSCEKEKLSFNKPDSVSTEQQPDKKVKFQGISMGELMGYSAVFLPSCFCAV